MLPTLPNTDLLNHAPDVDDLAIWQSGFVRQLIPAGYGCYAFFEQRTGIIVYIGSGISDSGITTHRRGLRGRLHCYRSAKTSSTTAKVVAYNKHEPLLVRCWLVANKNDALKYEIDAIERYRPKLNLIGTRSKSLEQCKQIIHTYSQATTNKYRATVYNPNAIKFCRGCQLAKSCREFQRNRNKAMGVKSRCKRCMARS